MKTFKVNLIAVAIAAVFLAISSVQAEIDITADQIGSNVVVTLAGTFNTSSGVLFAPHATTIGISQVYPSYPLIAYGNNSILDAFTHPNFTGPSNYGPGSFTSANSSVLVTNGFYFDLNQIDLPTAYVSGSPLSETMTFNSATFASLGMTPDTYTWTWSNNGNSDSLVLQIGAPVPEPSTYVMLALGGFGLTSIRFLRRKLVA